MTPEDTAISLSTMVSLKKPETEELTTKELSHAQDIERFIPPPRSPSSTRRIRIQNRRRRYLERHPSYFEGESGGYVNEDAAGRREMVGMVGKEAVGSLVHFQTY